MVFELKPEAHSVNELADQSECLDLLNKKFLQHRMVAAALFSCHNCKLQNRSLRLRNYYY